MNILAIDTSSFILSVAVKSATGKVVCHEEHAGQTHAERLPTVCDDVLFRAQIAYGELNCIVVGSGPGSFTGLRIGYAFAKGIAAALKIPIIQRSSYHAFHASTPDIATVLGDARSGLFFYGYQFEEPRLLAENALLQLLKERSTSSVIGVETLPPSLGSLAIIEPKDIAMQLLQLTASQSIPDFSIAQVSEITPQYLRAAAAKTVAERSMLTKQ